MLVRRNERGSVQAGAPSRAAAPQRSTSAMRSTHAAAIRRGLLAGHLQLQDVPQEQRPLVIRESEAEWARRGQWGICLPVMEEPGRYSHLQAAPAISTNQRLLEMWLQQRGKQP